MERLTGPVQHYAWGSTTAIPDLVGAVPDGQPWAELWLGAHPSAPARIGDTGLDALVAADPGIVGTASVDRFGPRLPYLMKLLAAARPLSLQAHPSRARAESGFAAEEAAGVPRDDAERNYRDDWPKPEVLCALGDFEALYGFADPSMVADHLARLGISELDALVEPLRRPGGAEGIRTVFLRLCRLDGPERDLVERVAAAAADGVGEPTPYGLFCRTAVELAEAYPRDPGVLAALLMNRMSLRAGEAIYLPAGNLHAYLRGLGVEIMANSDNVLRGGLTAKHVDVDELTEVLDFSPVRPRVVVPQEEEPGVFVHPTPAPEFRLWRLEVSHPIAVPATPYGRILVVTSGAVRAGDLVLEQGQSAWAPAGEAVTLIGEGQDGQGQVFVGAPGVHPDR
ncbi:MAG TPA: mannose-6-phosphate isomerase, class I [Candidatus Avipropionibacterium avicola]|uniref:mannose-6-phosphate isomerase n=1 Tax=Candidatus Avipropionibacterium avicola TaxID=2840701 RepID=A0A9D1GWM6_9ACTN|nr:mannose-6-phosphate isomerase, class I [Candidatus Avipropionibacterium avicola]